ncbi:hypothetical protein JAAARDRAFT_238259 [Jaapia argillacea MUCL 33604]|uniref:HSF-type DNA-binding domain-containing protein n=1 Tax=Jaapia argillacea MUCL 33604 TaxID=933084 RepID=A0A067QMN6_9AGAM|nr:hypothetical protein JAAARDRAFT_238259 [Jaapia argillacea MUCL 33604]
MIRWDPTGEHIIVEKPEQLALHVLPSVYRQSRFASFSRQLNIYGFMRKVNLRNVDPAIDDPDASTWSHPTLNRHSPAEVVANFKRRVPPRLPKPKKRDTDPASLQQGSRSATGLGPHGGNPVPFQVPSSYGAKPISNSGRQRGFSAPGSFTPLSQGGAAAAGWGSSYPHPGGMRGALPPLTVPSDPPSAMGHGGMYTHSPGGYPLNSPGEEPGYGGAPTHNGLPGLSPYSSSGPGGGGSQYPYTQSEPPQQSSWGMGGSAGSNAGGASSHSGSLSSLLNPSSGSGYSSSGYHHPSSSHAHSSHQRPTINTSYSSPYSSMPTTASSIPSPDSRPNTGYSVSSMSSMPPYEDGYGSRPGSSAHRPLSPGSRPPSAHSKSYHNGTGSLRVAPTKGSRRHSQAMSPYPSPYDHHHGPNDSRPSTSPHPPDDHHHSGSAMPRVRSMIQLPSVDSYSFNPSQGDFAYSAGGGDSAMDTTPPHHQPQHPHSSHGWAPSGEHEAYGRQLRPSTSASSVSASSAATPPGTGHGEGGYGQADVNRCEYRSSF